MVAVGMTAATSCSDFDDYNEAPSDGLNVSADKTLWENIESNEQLSNFAQLAKRVGFDQNLKSTRYYTVWAPLNSALDLSQYEEMDSATLMQEFIQNHVAEYNHAASGEIDERIRTLNNKAYDFKGDGTNYTFDDLAICNANVPSVNGVMHVLNGVAKYLPNAYDYILEKGTGFDSVRAYFQRYQETYLDKDKSVIGPIENGKQTYIDSVIVTTNSLTSRLDMKADDEDSSYTVLLPSDEAWTTQYNKVKKYYNYIATIKSQDLKSSTSTSTDNDAANIKTLSVANSYLSDSLAKKAITDYLVFNNNNVYNAKLADGTFEFGSTDSLRTTGRNQRTTTERYNAKLSNPTELLAPRTSVNELSNGQAIILDSIASYPWETFSRELDFPATEYYYRILSGNRYTLSWVEHDSIENTDITYNYLWAKPLSDYGLPELDMKLPNVKSIAYNFYCVFAPGYDSDSDTLDTRPNRVNFTLNYCKANGSLDNYKFSADGKSNPTTPTPFSNDPAKENEYGVLIPDTVFLGSFTFPVSYAGLSDDEIMPNLKIVSKINAFNKKELAAYCRSLRIMGIILKPVEQDNYEATKE